MEKLIQRFHIPEDVSKRDYCSIDQRQRFHGCRRTSTSSNAGLSGPMCLNFSSTGYHIGACVWLLDCFLFLDSTTSYRATRSTILYIAGPGRTMKTAGWWRKWASSWRPTSPPYPIAHTGQKRCVVLQKQYWLTMIEEYDFWESSFKPAIHELVQGHSHTLPARAGHGSNGFATAPSRPI